MNHLMQPVRGPRRGGQHAARPGRARLAPACRSARRSARRVEALALGAAIAWAGLPGGELAAQSVDVLVSLTADNALLGGPVRDEDLVRHDHEGLAYVAWPAETLALLTGDGDADGLFDVFTDIDAIHDGGGATAGEGLLVSVMSNEAGFLDGDVIGFGPGGAFVFLSEGQVIDAVGATDGDVDVDGVHVDADGTVVFSLAEDEASSVLSGDVPGEVADGAILAWSAGDAFAEILLTESQVAAMVEQALGSAQSIGDTKGVSRDPSTGELLFCVQSPSAHDASVFSAAQGGVLLDGHSEDDFAFTDAAELDGLSVVASRFAGLGISNGRPQEGETVTATIQGAQPGWPQLVLASLSLFETPQLPLDGWGAFVLVEDDMLLVSFESVVGLVIVPDGLGSGTLIKELPVGLPPIDVVVQAIAPGGHARGSNPLVIEMVQ